MGENAVAQMVPEIRAKHNLDQLVRSTTSTTTIQGVKKLMSPYLLNVK